MTGIMINTELVITKCAETPVTKRWAEQEKGEEEKMDDEAE